jgi:hypothetical protein
MFLWRCQHEKEVKQAEASRAAAADNVRQVLRNTYAAWIACTARVKHMRKARRRARIRAPKRLISASLSAWRCVCAEQRRLAAAETKLGIRTSCALRAACCYVWKQRVGRRRRATWGRTMEKQTERMELWDALLEWRSVVKYMRRGRALADRQLKRRRCGVLGASMELWSGNARALALCRSACSKLELRFKGEMEGMRGLLEKSAKDAEALREEYEAALKQSDAMIKMLEKRIAELKDEIELVGMGAEAKSTELASAKAQVCVVFLFVFLFVFSFLRGSGVCLFVLRCVYVGLSVCVCLAVVACVFEYRDSRQRYTYILYACIYI